MTLEQLRSKMVPWLPRIGRAVGGRAVMGRRGDDGGFELVVSWKDGELRRRFTEGDTGVRACGHARHLIEQVLRERGLDV